MYISALTDTKNSLDTAKRLGDALKLAESRLGIEKYQLSSTLEFFCDKDGDSYTPKIGPFQDTLLTHAAKNNYLCVIKVVLLGLETSVGPVTDEDTDDESTTSDTEVSHFDFTSIENYTDIVNRTDSNGRTALHHACARGAMEMAELLMRFRARTDIKDNNGNTPIDLAKDEKIKDAVSSTDFLCIQDTISLGIAHEHIKMHTGKDKPPPPSLKKDLSDNPVPPSKIKMPVEGRFVQRMGDILYVFDANKGEFFKTIEDKDQEAMSKEEKKTFIDAITKYCLSNNIDVSKWYSDGEK